MGRRRSADSVMLEQQQHPAQQSQQNFDDVKPTRHMSIKAQAAPPALVGRLTTFQAKLREVQHKIDTALHDSSLKAACQQALLDLQQTAGCSRVDAVPVSAPLAAASDQQQASPRLVDHYQYYAKVSVTTSLLD